MYDCSDSFANDSLKNDVCDVIDSLSPNSFESPSSVSHTLDPTLALKPLPYSLKYVFLDPNETYPIIIAFDMTEDQEEKLLKVLKDNKEAIGWSLSDIKGISPQLCNIEFSWRIMLNLIEITKDV